VGKKRPADEDASFKYIEGGHTEMFGRKVSLTAREAAGLSHLRTVVRRCDLGRE
jgi:hypothetical protein